MTFLEAAIEVLRTAEEPLHYADITRLAVERKLLSHVGRDPEAAMQSCLNSAVRSQVHDGVVIRSKPGHYQLDANVAVPDLPPAPTGAAPLPDVDDAEGPSGRKKASKSKVKASGSSKDSRSRTSSKDSSKDDAKDSASKDSASKDSSSASKAGPKRRSRTRAPKSAEPTEPTEDQDEQDGSDQAAELGSSADAPIPPMPPLDPSKVRFRGPDGSGLEGETDVTLVMANAMSRLVVERPELREELEAMQKGQAPVPEVIEVGRKKRVDDDRDRLREREREEDRSGRRRRRRRRKGRRVEWTENSGRAATTRSNELLDKVAEVLGEGGTRSLHVRQIAEQLAAHNVLGGEISEIERAVTAAMLLDVHRRGDASRFAIRGDARYQLRGSRVPDKAAAAERAARAALLALEGETEAQLLLWLQSLGARSLEALVRIWLDREGFSLVATLPPSRGLGKLVVDDPEPDEDDGRTLVLIVPRKTSLEPKLWEGEAERNACAATLVFTMIDAPAESANGPLAGVDARVIFARDLTRWLLRQGIGVRTLEIKVPVLDADLIESIAGLDT